MFAPSEGMALCIECLVGYASPDSPDGSSRSRLECDACLPGFYRDSLAMETCQECADGQFTSMNGSITCQVCPLGFKAKNTSGDGVRDACLTCIGAAEDKGGKFSRTNGTTNADGCDDCPTGWFSPPEAKSAPSCTECAPGYYANATGMDVCLPCAKGKYSEKSPFENCKDCDAGTEATHTSTVKCRKCDKGQYQETNGSTSPCLPCEQNKFAATLKSKICEPCADGMRSAPGSDECVPDCGSDLSPFKCLPG